MPSFTNNIGILHAATPSRATGSLGGTVEGVTMRKASTLLLAAASLLFVGSVASVARAQDMSFSEEETQGGSSSSDMSFSESETQSDSSGGSGDVISDLAGASDSNSPSSSSTRDEPANSDEAREEIYAVQRIPVLRASRVELSPSIAQSLNDPFVGHTGIGVGLNYWWTNVLALGVNFIWYEGLESQSDLNFQVRRGTRLGVPINQYQFGANLNFTYVPVYGKFSMFNEFIFQYDAYILGGVGLMRTRPIPVIDPEVRSFDYDLRIAFNVGVGLRVFITRWLTIFAEIRDYMYLEQLENLTVQLGAQRATRSTWVDQSLAFTNNVTAHVGFTVFLPLDFEYRLPR